MTVTKYVWDPENDNLLGETDDAKMMATWKMSIKGDTVMMTAGNDKGVSGEVLRVIMKQDRVVVQGVNVRTKHLKPTQTNPQGGIIRREMPVHMSNVSPVKWGIVALEGAIWRGYGLPEMALPCGILIAVGFVSLTIGWAILLRVRA